MIVRDYSKNPQYLIDMVGLASDSIGIVTIDGKYALIQLHPTYSVIIVPPIGDAHLTFEEIVFYTNCLAYEHDIPALIRPIKVEALIRPVEKGRKEYIDRSYHDSLSMACEAINSLRWGPLGYVYFRWPSHDTKVNLLYTKQYSCVAKEISLYSTAVRQLDPLSEFLNYYRIIESISGNNGKSWLSANLTRLANYSFGFLEYEIVGEERVGNQRRNNLFSVYKRRAISRLKELDKKLGKRSIAEYFYNENRCGIAHGKTDTKTYDFGYTIQEISLDVYVLKLLTRIAIEDKFQSPK